MQIHAIYENGILRPIEKIDLEEQQKVEIIVMQKKSAVDRTKGMFKADSGLAKFIAEDDSILWEE